MAYFFSSCDWTNIDKVPLFKVKHIFLKKNPFYQRLLIGTSWILFFEMKLVFSLCKHGRGFESHSAQLSIVNTNSAPIFKHKQLT